MRARIAAYLTPVRVRRIPSLGAASLRRAALAAALLACLTVGSRAQAAVSLGGVMAHSPDDISGFTSLTGDDNTVNVTLPFTFTVEGTNFTTLTLSTNGWIEFGTNTSGSSEPGNACLPVSTHTNPFLAAYWDDLVPFGTNIRYGTVGTSPNRVFIADYEVDLFSGSEGSDDLRFQVQLHERSNVITVRYRDQQSATNAISATIGFQGAGGGSATTVQPLTCNGKVLDDNRPNEGWSADVGRAGLVTLAAVMAHSPDDITGFTTLTGDETTASVTLPFTFNIEGTNYSTIVISTNGWIEFGTNTSGGADFNNGCLPVSNHTNPFLAAYWDDLVPFGTNIRYGIVGTAPNRTFIADYEVDLFSGTEGSDDTRFQIQLHERSNLINVRFRDSQHLANAQSATIGFQGAGGGSAAAYPLTCNGKVLDDNQNDRDAWSIHPKALGAMSLHSILAHSPDDISGFTTFTGDNSTTSVTMPFSVAIDGVSYSTIAISTNGWIEFGSNTSGSSDPVNSCLPTASHTNPFLAAYWDDMTTASTNIRHGTVGTAPNRVFIADFYLLTTTGGDDSGGDDIAFQVEIHEGSNTIGVKSYLSQHVANGQAATIGFQGAGGAAATAMPLTCNGKILDDNRPGEGWSIAPLPICGNSLTETKEQCDQGGANGAATSCCTSVCLFRAAGQICRNAAGACDVAETCTGSSATCPADGFASAATVCRASAGVCDLTENCTGSAAACPADGKSTAVCRASAGVCDVAESCNGVGNNCPGDAFASSATVCRGLAGICDVAENCTGSSASCPADGFATSATVCRTSAGVCDLQENCTGSGSACPADAKSTAVCRGAAGVCDVAESCNGVANTCPADGFASAATVCRASAGVCDLQENCTGSGSACPADAKSTAVCRASAGVCDVAESCDGAANACPADGFAAAATVCRASAGSCDVAENCTGSSAPCPADGFQSSATVCRASAGVCDTAENCTGSSAACPGDGFQSSATVCRASAGVCDTAENCTGSAAACPADAFQSAATVCRAAGGVCDLAENCSGSAAACPADLKSTAVCRASAGVCDVAETCDGLANACPADAFASAVIVCRGSAGICDLQETCTGSGPACPADVKSTAVCRATAGVCDVAENCDGVANACPADAFQSSATVCRSAAGVCDVTENCTGSGAACPADAKSTAVCRAAAAVCDAAESCDGSADDCPGDAFAPSATVCRAATGGCDIAENCTGTGPACPSDTVASSATVCRSAVGVCDVAENCDGTNVDCPAEAYASAAVVCRSAADVCDVDESCTGSGPNCPADSFASSATVCRAATDICDVTENCTGSSAPCPGDAVEPPTTVCRPAASTADAPESCDGSTKFCPADSFLPAGTPCNDGDFCTLRDEADGLGTCVGYDPVDCDDVNPCTDDTCDSQAGGFLCTYMNNGSCVGECGNLVVDAGETCDPPNLTLDPTTGQTECRLDCTACGDGVVQANNTETCDDGNTVSGCRPDQPQRPLDSCLNNCNEPICADPARIKFGKAGQEDLFYFHGRLISDVPVDFVNNHFVIELRDSTGAVIYRSSLLRGSIEVQNVKSTRYKNRGAREGGGVYQFKSKAGAGHYVLTLKTYGDLSGAVADMTTHVYVADDEWVVRGMWTAQGTKGWKLSNKATFLPVP